MHLWSCVHVYVCLCGGVSAEELLSASMSNSDKKNNNGCDDGGLFNYGDNVE